MFRLLYNIKNFYQKKFTKKIKIILLNRKFVFNLLQPCKTLLNALSGADQELDQEVPTIFDLPSHTTQPPTVLSAGEGTATVVVAATGEIPVLILFYKTY